MFYLVFSVWLIYIHFKLLTYADFCLLFPISFLRHQIFDLSYFVYFWIRNTFFGLFSMLGFRTSVYVDV